MASSVCSDHPRLKAGLPPTPRGWNNLCLNYVPSALPPLPQLSPIARTFVTLDRPDMIKRLSWVGDAVLEGAATSNLIAQVFELAGIEKWLYLFRSDVLSNNVFSYLALSYGLIDPLIASMRPQKASADLFEAYLGACELERESIETMYEFKWFFKALFSEMVWPTIRFITQVPTFCSLPSKEFKRVISQMTATWPGMLLEASDGDRTRSRRVVVTPTRTRLGKRAKAAYKPTVVLEARQDGCKRKIDSSTSSDQPQTKKKTVREQGKGKGRESPDEVIIDLVSSDSDQDLNDNEDSDRSEVYEALHDDRTVERLVIDLTMESSDDEEELMERSIHSM
ncbi:hypothetical protein BD324DRAFT_97359 [Kockovaella imperatae]|uniref:RNase III domain-containing protein n=1 Tax=Kockovaella imperatae TaxID=4999 RepID=A0A1Y1UBP7_9TREE|nr:hypothetical protein BD324DRAFT_97359 [Kockovaella imperatae]ORX35422.1 hypothetical protein BD324DRAFT_97359 [Kockovaella imperatae]